VRKTLIVAVTVAAGLMTAGRVFGESSRVVAKASVDSTAYRLGDPIHVRIAIHHPPGATFHPLVGDTLSSFSVLERQPVVQADDSLTTTAFTLAAYSPGQTILPPIEFASSIPGDTTRIVTTNPLVFSITAVAVDTTKDIRDLKPPLSIPLTVAEVLTIIGIVLALLAAAYVAYRYWKHRKARKAAGVESAAPERPAHVIAFEQLALLREKKLWQQGFIKQYYSEITEIFRRYLENRYAIQAMEETSDEILSALQKLRFPGTMMADADRILRRADLVKFAKYQPSLEEHEEIFTVIHDFVDKTKIVQMTPVPQETLKVAVHAGN
jgi:hypothetical protein